MQKNARIEITGGVWEEDVSVAIDEKKMAVRNKASRVAMFQKENTPKGKFGKTIGSPSSSDSPTAN